MQRLRLTPVLALALLAPAAPADARPDLTVTKVSKPPSSVAEGGTLRLRDTVRNRGNRKSKRTDTRFYLSRDAKRSLTERRRSRANPRLALGDVLLSGSRRVKPLKPGKRSAAKRSVRVVVPAGTAAGTYQLLACADDRGAVRERREAGNCRIARRKVRVMTPAVFGSGELRVQAFSDTNEQPDLAQDQRLLTAFRPQMCRAAVPAKRVASLSGGLRSLKRSLSQKAGADAMAAFKRSPEYKSAAAAQKGAAMAMAVDQPGAALAALIRAHELQPKKASHLVNAAAVASTIGYPNEALALLDGAARLDPDGTPMGISRHAAALANRAQAYGMTGRWAEAEAAGQAALASEPLLSEAAATLTVASACRDKATPAVSFRRRSRNRQSPPPDPPIDESKGQSSTLRPLPLPANPARAVDMYDFYRRKGNEEGSELTARSRREQQLNASLRAKDARRPAATASRRQAILLRLYRVGERSAITQSRNAYLAPLNRAHAVRYRIWEGESSQYSRWTDQSQAACTGAPDYGACYAAELRSRCIPGVRNAHQQWLNEMFAAHRAAQSHYGALSKAQSAIASNLSDPDAYALGLSYVEGQEGGVWFGLQQSAEYWTRWLDQFKEHCVAGNEPVPDPNVSRQAARGSGPCPTGLTTISAIVDVGPLAIKVKCEEISIEGSTPGWIGAFAEVTWAPRSSKMTLFVGGKVSAGAGIKGEIKSGFYITQENTTLTSGDITDVGTRFQRTVTAGAGPIEYQVSDTVSNLSFVGAAAPPGGT